MMLNSSFRISFSCIIFVLNFVSGQITTTVSPLSPLVTTSTTTSIPFASTTTRDIFSTTKDVISTTTTLAPAITTTDPLVNIVTSAIVSSTKEGNTPIVSTTKDVITTTTAGPKTQSTSTDTSTVAATTKTTTSVPVVIITDPITTLVTTIAIVSTTTTTTTAVPKTESTETTTVPATTKTTTSAPAVITTDPFTTLVTTIAIVSTTTTTIPKTESTKITTVPATMTTTSAPVVITTGPLTTLVTTIAIASTTKDVITTTTTAVPKTESTETTTIPATAKTTTAFTIASESTTVSPKTSTSTVFLTSTVADRIPMLPLPITPKANTLVSLDNIYISEVCLDNRSILKDELNAYRPWIELVNPTNVSVNMTHYTLSITGYVWNFPIFMFPPNSCLVLIASGRVTLPQSTLPPFHTNFVLVPNDIIFLKNSSQSVVSSLDYSNLNFLPDISIGISNQKVVYFMNPSLNVPNNLSMSTRLGIVMNPIFSSQRGFYSSFVLLFILGDPASTIYYSLDNSLPNESSSIYSGIIINITNSITVRVTACISVFICSPVITHSYIISSSLSPSELALPNLFIVTEKSNSFWLDSSLMESSLEILYPKDDFYSLSANCGIRGIGSISLKRSLQVNCDGKFSNFSFSSEIFTNNISSNSNSIFNPTSFTLIAYDFRNWVSNSSESLFLMDRFVSFLQETSFTSATRGEFLHTYVNGIYYGIYSLTENVDSNFVQNIYGTVEEGAGKWNIFPIWNLNDISNPPRQLFNFSSIFLRNFTDSSNYDFANSVLNLNGFIDFVLLQFLTGMSGYIWPNISMISKNGTFPQIPYLVDAELAIDGVVPIFINPIDNSVISRKIISPFVPVSYKVKPNFTLPWIPRLWSSLLENPNFKILLSDRIQALLCEIESPWNQKNTISYFFPLTRYIAAAVPSEVLKYGFGSHNLVEWEISINRTSQIISNLTEKMLILLKKENWLSQIPCPNIVSNQQIVTYATMFSINGDVNVSSFQRPSFNSSFYFTMDGSDPRNSIGKFGSNSFLFNSLMFIKISSQDSLPGIISSRSYEKTTGIWSAIRTISFSIVDTQIKSSFLFFNDSRAQLTPDLDVNNSPIFSALVTVCLFGIPITSSTVFEIRMSSINPNIFSSLKFEFVMPTIGSVRQNSLLLSVIGSSYSSFIVYSSAPLSDIVLFEISSAGSYSLDSRHIFNLENTIGVAYQFIETPVPVISASCGMLISITVFIIAFIVNI